MPHNDADDVVPERSAIPGRDEPEEPRETGVMGRSGEVPERDVMGADDEGFEPVMGGPDQTEHEVMGDRQPRPEKVLGEDVQADAEAEADER